MPLFSCGINHHLTPIDLRERLSIDLSYAPQVLNGLCQKKAVNEAVLITTCHRTEIYWVGENTDPVREWFQEQSAYKIKPEEHFYTHQDIAAVRHLLRVSSGLDSMVLGEPQILGQIKQAYKIACEAGTVGQQLKHLFPAAFSSAKQIRHQSQLGAHPISMAYATLQLAKRIFANLSKCSVLLVGAGEMVELMITHLKAQGIKQIIIANRTLQKAEHLISESQGQAIRISDIPSYLPQVDIIITATASQLPILGKGLMERTLKMQKHRPILMVDLAVPRNIEPEVAELADIYLYNIDDLQSILTANLKNRREAAKHAETLIEWQAAHYMKQLQVLNISDIIKEFRRPAFLHRDQLLQKALKELQQGKEAKNVLSYLAFQLTNKILHEPTQKLREAAYQQEKDLLFLAKKLLTNLE